MADNLYSKTSVKGRVNFDVSSTFRFSEVEFAKLIYGSNGDVQKFLRVATIAAKAEAQVLAKKRLSAVKPPRYSDWHRAGNKSTKKGAAVYPGRTGDYDKNFYFRTRKGVTGVSWTLGNRSDYAAIVENGTRRTNYPISVKKARNLVYFSNGSYHRKKSVQHPGPWRKSSKKFTKVSPTSIGPGAHILNDAIWLGFKVAKRTYVPGKG